MAFFVKSLKTAAAVIIATGAFTQCFAQAASDPAPPDAVQAMMLRSRYLQDAYFSVPVSLYQQYLRDRDNVEPAQPAPVPFIAQSAVYAISIDADQKATLQARIVLRVFDKASLSRTDNPQGTQKDSGLGVLSSTLAWRDVAVNKDKQELATAGGFLRFTPEKNGLYELTATASLPSATAAGGSLDMPILPTNQTLVRVDAPQAWQVTAEGSGWAKLVGSTTSSPPAGQAAAGTHGQLALVRRASLQVVYGRVQGEVEHASRYELRGDVAWNIDAAAQQVAASLMVTVAGGASDRVELLVDDRADRVSVTGPEVKEVQVSSGRAVVYLRGKILGQTILKLSYAMPLGDGNVRQLGRLEVRDGHWAGGTLVVTNTAGDSEVLPSLATGLREMPLADLPSSAAGILVGPAVRVYEITARQFAAAVEIIRLGEFALRQSIVDLAHYEVFVSADGAVICRARYEIRNRNRQFFQLSLPAGSQVLLTRVNEKSVPVSALASAGEAGSQQRYLIRLERSRASILGLVSFPVEIVFTCRTGALAGSGTLEIPLPAVDLPIAYGWCETYVPHGVAIKKWSGPLKPVEQFSSLTAKASLDYGYGEMAEGYVEKSRPTASLGEPVAVAPKPSPAATRPAGPGTKGVMALRPIGGPAGGIIPNGGNQVGPPPTGASTASGEVSYPPNWRQLTASRSMVSGPATLGSGKGGNASAVLARNYFRAGQDFYEQGDFENARKSLKEVERLAPGSNEATNASRLLSNTMENSTIEIDGAATISAGTYKMTASDSIGDASRKAAVLEVHREQAEMNRPMEQLQEKMIEEALQDAREGNSEKANAKLKAAETLNKQLLASNSDVGPQRMSKLAKSAQAIKSQDQERVRGLHEEFKSLKQSGQYDKALQTGKKILIAEGNGSPIAKELDEVAILSARASPASGRARGLELKRQEDVLQQSSAITKVYRGAVLDGMVPGETVTFTNGAQASAASSSFTNTWNAPIPLEDNLDLSAGRVKGDARSFTVQKGIGFGNGILIDALPQTAEQVQGRTFTMNGGLVGSVSAGSASGVRVNAPASAPAMRVVGGAARGSATVSGSLSDGMLLGGGGAVLKVSAPPFSDHKAPVMSQPARAAETEVRVSPESQPPTNRPFKLPEPPVTVRVYDVRDLVYSTPQFAGPSVDLASAGNNASGNTASSGQDRDSQASRRERVAEITRAITEAVGKDSWQAASPQGAIGSIKELRGTLVVTQTSEAQQKIADLIAKLREARGPQVEMGGKLALQSVRLGTYVNVLSQGVNDSDGRGNLSAADPAVRDFIERNYDWSMQKAAFADAADGKADLAVNSNGAAVSVLSGRISNAAAGNVDALAYKLKENLGQKVVVNSVNNPATTQAAEELGVRFEQGANGVRWAILDEAQVRSLGEVAANAKAAYVEPNGRAQETIVGTDAALANGWTANIAYAGESANTLDVWDNAITLSHEKYLAIDNGGYLTLVKAGQMQHWTEKPAAVQFVEIPQNIEVPRVGQLIKFEKVLIESSAATSGNPAVSAGGMTLRAQYVFQGVSQ